MFLAIAAAAAVVSADPLIAVPDGPWSARQTSTTCLVSRDYVLKTGDELKLYLNPDLVGDGLVILVDGPAAGRNPGYHDDPSIVLENGQRIERVHMITDAFAEGRLVTRVTTNFSPDTSPRREVKETTNEDIMRLARMSPKKREQRRRDFLVEKRDDIGPRTSLEGNRITIMYDEDTGQQYGELHLGEVRAFLDDCREKNVAALFRDAPLPPAPFKQAVEFKSGIDMDDMPRRVQRGQKTQVETLLRIDADGKVTDCHLLIPSGFEDFDQKYCSLVLQGATFIPAEDSGGNAVESLFHWRDFISIVRQSFTSSDPL